VTGLLVNIDHTRRPAAIAAPVAHRRDFAGAVPPTSLVLLSIISVQIGAALAKSLFRELGSSGTVFVRIAFAALILLAIVRPRVRGHSTAAYVAVVAFGLTIAAMNTAFYAAIARLPLGIAVTLEFIGPLGVAVAGSRRRLDLLWTALAASGVLLLMPWAGTGIDLVGMALALVAAIGWAAYILLNVRVGKVFSGHDGLAIAMCVSCAAVLPFGGSDVRPLLDDPLLLLACFGVAVLSTVIPFSLEHAALKRLPAQVFGVLMSVEPAAAATAGAVFLHEALSLRGLLALVAISLASAGSARTGARDD
jgi:inner membrane transporter RhtA